MIDLGKHYVALNVQDIVVSKAFYEKLGFVQDTRWGSIEDKWITMNNGDIMIGLYQGMFPKNILTFNPDNARNVYKAVKEDGLEVGEVLNIDKEEGPCHFTLTDPDGNPILIDQHF